MASVCGSIVVVSVAEGCSGVDPFILKRPSFAVIATGWSNTVYCISMSWVFEATSAVAAVSTDWAGVAVADTPVDWADGAVVVP